MDLKHEPQNKRCFVDKDGRVVKADTGQSRTVSRVGRFEVCQGQAIYRTLFLFYGATESGCVRRCRVWSCCVVLCGVRVGCC